MASTDDDHRGLLRLCVLHIMETLGIDRSEVGAIDFCAEFAEKYIISLARKSRDSAATQGRGWIGRGDVATALETSMPCGPRSRKEIDECELRYGSHWKGSDTFGIGGDESVHEKQRRALERRKQAEIIAGATRDAPRLRRRAPIHRVADAAGASDQLQQASAAALSEVESKFKERPPFYPSHLPPMPMSHSYMATVASAGGESRAGDGASSGADAGSRLAILENASLQGGKTLSALRDLIRVEERKAGAEVAGPGASQADTESAAVQPSRPKRARVEDATATNLQQTGMAAGEQLDNPLLAKLSS